MLQEGDFFLLWDEKISNIKCNFLSIIGGVDIPSGIKITGNLSYINISNFSIKMKYFSRLTLKNIYFSFFEQEQGSILNELYFLSIIDSDVEIQNISIRYLQGDNSFNFLISQQSNVSAKSIKLLDEVITFSFAIIENRSHISIDSLEMKNPKTVTACLLRIDKESQIIINRSQFSFHQICITTSKNLIFYGICNRNN